MASRRKFSDEYNKREAVRLATEPGVTKSQVGRELGINANCSPSAGFGSPDVLNDKSAVDPSRYPTNDVPPNTRSTLPTSSTRRRSRDPRGPGRWRHRRRHDQGAGRKPYHQGSPGRDRHPRARSALGIASEAGSIRQGFRGRDRGAHIKH